MSCPAKFVHDTRHIVDVNPAGCDLFRCNHDALVDLDMMTLIISPDFRGLARLRMQMFREMKMMPAIKYKFIRCDGTRFWATVHSVAHGSDGLFETTVVYEGEA